MSAKKRTAKNEPPKDSLRWKVIDYLSSNPGERLTRKDASTKFGVDQTAVDFFRLTWDLKDLATYIPVLREPHRHNEDTAKAYEGLKNCIAIRDRWAALERTTR